MPKNRDRSLDGDRGWMEGEKERRRREEERWDIGHGRSAGGGCGLVCRVGMVVTVPGRSTSLKGSVTLCMGWGAFIVGGIYKDRPA
jgi:hypothetical protein